MKRFAVHMVLSDIIRDCRIRRRSGSGTVRLDSAVKVGTTELPAGSYKVTWTGTGDNAQVTLKQGKYSKSPLPAQVVDAKHSGRDRHQDRERNARAHRDPVPEDKTLVLQNATAQVAGR